MLPHQNEKRPIIMESLTRKDTCLLVALYMFRVLCCFTYGYIHPDEFFQSGQELFFRNDASSSSTVPSWEWESHTALRSIVPPTIMSWIPSQSYAMFKRWYCRIPMSTTCDIGLNGLELWIIPRIFMCLTSLVGIDATLWFLLRKVQYNDGTTCKTFRDTIHTTQYILPIFMVLATSWTTLLFGTRPFTNTLETIDLSLLLAIVFGYSLKAGNPCITPITIQSRTTLTYSQIKQSTIALLVGCLYAVGVFTRLTFVGFATPVVLIFLSECANEYSSQRQFAFQNDKHRPISQHLFSFRAHYVIGFIYSTVGVIVGVLGTSIFLLNADVTFYHGISIWEVVSTKSWQIIWKTVTPLNFFQYNTKSNNLAQHGIHPRYLHAVVNMPLMFGPLTVLHWIYLAQCLKFRFHLWWSRKWINFTEKANNSTIPTARPTCNQLLDYTLNAIILSGLTMLSFAPHQEPRFLLPLIIPLTLLHGRSISSGKVLIVFWIIFNSLLLVFFGLLHQSGVIPSLLFVGNQLSHINQSMRPNIIVYYKTYMPPSFLLHNKIMIPLDYSSVLNSTYFSDVCESNLPAYGISGHLETLLEERKSSNSPGNRTRLVDLKSESDDSFCSVIQGYLPHCSIGNSSSSSNTVYAVMPSIIVSKLPCNYSFHHVWGVNWHVTTEDFPQWTNNAQGGVLHSASLFVQRLQLAVYNITCMGLEI